MIKTSPTLKKRKFNRGSEGPARISSTSPPSLDIDKRGGFSLVEVILATSLFAMMVTAVVGAIIYGRESTALAGSRVRAVFLAEEGLEAARNLRDQRFNNLTDGAYGLAASGGQWVFSGSNDITDIFTRQVAISPIDSKRKNVVANVTWQQNPHRLGSIALSTYLTNWSFSRGGMLVYGSGGAATDLISYRLLDPRDGTWGSSVNTADIHPGTTNRVLQAVQVYASATRNEKVMLSRHSNATSQFIYGQVWSGTSWGNVVQLSTWNNNTFLDVQNFSGAYLANGDFMVVYSDNTATPKFRVWNGSLWLAQTPLPNIGGIPNYIVARARPGTNEVMAAFFDQSSDTNTAYFNGGAYSTANWALHAQHSAVAPVNTKQLVDFAWSPNNPLVGGLVYSNSGTDVSMNIRIWTASGAGSGSWSVTVNTTNQASRLGALAISGRRGANEFIACDKDANATPRIICYRSNFTPVWTNPVNPIVAPAPPGTDPGIQKSYDLSFEPATGNTALVVYSDASAVPKFKKYTAAGNSWDASPSSLPAAPAALETVRVIPHPDTDDLMILLGDTNQNLSSVVWDGVGDAFYAVPSSHAFTTHAPGGVADLNFWFDFAWDKF